MRKITGFIISRISKKWGTARIKKLIWDKEFSSGQWSYINSTGEDIIYHYIEKYSNNGTILDIGCGAGNTGNELSINKYEKYAGLDISQNAVNNDILRSQQNNRSGKNYYFCGDMLTYIRDEKYDLILFRESIWYVRKGKIHSMLQRYSMYLKDHGCFIVSICQIDKHGHIIRLIEQEYTILERFYDHERGIIIVFY
jgi:2-polyprenyl-3-methyl-5-hydroxy-6-metoxy-1,4-benzoquinol methylase